MFINNNLYTNNINNRQLKSNNNVNFQGFGVSPKAVLFKRNPDRLWRDCSYIANTIGQHTKTITSLLEYAPKKRIAFMESLTAGYNTRNFMLRGKLKEDSTPLLNIYKMVKEPEAAHFNIVSKSEMPCKTLEQIFTNATDKKSLEFVQKMQHDVLDGSKESGEQIVNMLKSPNRETYIKNADEYRSYMILNVKDKDAVKTLDGLVSSGEYNRASFDSKLTVKELMKNKNFSQVIGDNTKFIEDNYSEEGRRFLSSFCSDYLAYRRGLSEADHKDILMMYATSTPENIETRLEVINKFKNVYTQGQTETSEIRSMETLFRRMDNDEHAKTFVDKAIRDDIKIENMEELNRILDIVPSKKAAIFHKNIRRIVANTSIEEREQALLNHIENPLYSNPRVEAKNAASIRPPRKETYFEKLAKRVENTINMKRYNKLAKEGVDETEAKIKEFKPVIIPEKTDRPAIVVPLFEDAVTRPVEEDANTVKLVRMLTFVPSAKKLKVKKDIGNIIEQKLGEKTYEKQKGSYYSKATAIRLKLLPDIFESIAVTRKEQRAMGKKPKVENKNAVDLYNRIQGKNKKLVRYMLKQTDANNNRIFDINDIIKVIDNAEETIANNKKLNSEFKSKDAKAYYDSIYDSLTEQYGHLKRSKTKKA